MNIWLYAKCRKYVANAEEAAEHEAEVEVLGDYDGRMNSMAVRETALRSEMEALGALANA